MKFQTLTNCPRCGGNVRAESIGWKCEKCRGFIDMQGNFHEHVEKPFLPPITNADRIRAMSNEELSLFLCSLCDCYEGGCPGVEMCSLAGGRANGMLKWLEQPAEVET